MERTPRREEAIGGYVVLVQLRIAAGGPKDFVKWLTGQRLAYSVGFTLPANTPDLLERIDEAKTWTPAYDTDTDGIRDGAWVAELTGLLDLRVGRPGCG